MLPALLLLTLISPAGAYDQGRSALEDRILHAPWEDRLRVVRTLASRGPEGRELLELAARDPDWQIRAAAAEALGKAGGRAVGALRTLAVSDECRLVRMAAAHSLGRLGSVTRPPPEGEDDPSACASAYLPYAEGRGRKAVKAGDSTRPDEVGCTYLRFQRLGKAMCPAGLAVHGIGRPPESPKLLKVRGEDGGVALCCPDADGGAPEPVEVECRLIPEECPPPWSQMDEPADERTGKEGRYRRSERHAMGDLDWVQCCRPVPVELAEGAEPERAPIPESRRVRRKPTPAPALPELPEPAPPPPPSSGPSPESLIARRALERLRPPEAPPSARPAPELLPAPRGLDARGEERSGEGKREAAARPAPEPEVEEVLDLGEPESLPSPEGPAGRDEAPVEGEASLHAEERPEPRPGLTEKTALGAREGGLAAPKGISAREEAAVSGTAALMADGGMKRAKHDPLPVLIEKLSAPQPAVRARAAEMLADLGADGAPALQALLKAAQDTETRVRSNAALALGSVTAGSDAALPALKRLLKDSHPDVRYSAATALGRVGTPAAEKAFSRHLGTAAPPRR
ncbi:MAG: HEAT repeat domain-containing protein [Elusimicrobia bacterium]|nr:HEAT repeat domain-containing protein [Elusimicrobiota bacterium]